MAHDFVYPRDGTPNVYISPQWLAVPVHVADGIANCYLTGTGVVDFTDDPPWRWNDEAGFPLIPGTFKLTFAAGSTASPLREGDVYVSGSGLAAVGFAYVDRDTNAETWVSEILDSDILESEILDWTLALDRVVVKDVAPGSSVLEVEVSGAYRGDCWIDKIAYKIGLLVYRPSLTPPPLTRRPGWSRSVDAGGRLIDFLHQK